MLDEPAGRPESPTTTAATTDLDAMIARARAGDQAVLPHLRVYLDDHPELWRVTGDLARHVRDSWIGVIAGTDLIARESLTRTTAALAADLAGPTPTTLEQLLVDRVVACWLQVHYSDAAVAQVADPTPRQSALALKRQDAAQRRYLAAIGAFETLRRLTRPAVQPAVPRLLNDASTGATDAAATAVPPPSPADEVDAGDRQVPLTVFNPPDPPLPDLDRYRERSGPSPDAVTP